MKKTLTLIVALFLAVSFLPSTSHATAPSVVEPTYDAAAKTLSVKIRHWSLADGLHYIKYVDIKVNGTLLSTNKYSNQPDTEYTYTYNVAVAPGDAVEVTAKCNMWGSKTIALTIPGAATDGSPKPSDMPKTEK